MNGLIFNQTDGIAKFQEEYVPPDIRLVRELKSLIEHYFREIREPEFYSNKLNISLKRLNRLTGYYEQKTVYQLVQDRLHREAELLLRHTTLTAKEIAMELGVCDAAHFSKCFKAVTGLTPGAFRRGGPHFI